jgi:hypothetical protein
MPRPPSRSRRVQRSPSRTAAAIFWSPVRTSPRRRRRHYGLAQRHVHHRLRQHQTRGRHHPHDRRPHHRRGGFGRRVERGGYPAADESRQLLHRDNPHLEGQRHRRVHRSRRAGRDGRALRRQPVQIRLHRHLASHANAPRPTQRRQHVVRKRRRRSLDLQRCHRSHFLRHQNADLHRHADQHPQRHALQRHRCPECRRSRRRHARFLRYGH